MNCKNCGNPLSLDSKFCNVCGTKVESNIEGESNVVETPVKPEMTNVVNSIPSTEVVKPTETPEAIVNQNNEQPSMEQKEVVKIPEQTVNNQVSVIETSNNNGAADVQIPIVHNPTSAVESPNVVNNNVSTMQNQIVNNQVMEQNNQPVVNNNVSNNPIPNNMNNPAQSKKKTPVGLIVGIGVGAVFIIAIIFILILTGGIKFNATIKAGGTTKQIIGNKTTTTSKITSSSTTSRVTSNSTPNNNSSKSINAFDAILKLYTGDEPTDKTYDQVVAIIGEGVKDENYSLPKYIWKQDDNTQLSIVFYSSGKIMEVEIEYNKRDDLKDSNVNLSGAQAISKNINDQVPVYYNDIKTSFGNEGRLYGFSKYNYKYVWVSESGGYVEAKFERETNKCLSFFGRV